VEDDSGSWSAPAATLHLGQAIEPCPLVLVLVKSHQTRAIAAHAARAVSPEGRVVTLQNGLGNREILEERVGRGRVAAGVVTAGAFVIEPGHVSGHPGRVALGAEPPAPPALAELAALLRRAGFETELSADVERLVWRKLAVNCAINPLSVVRGTTNGALLERAEDRELLAAAAREVEQVARARGLELREDPAALVFEVARRTGANRSSMLQDVERGAPTEIEALNGAVVGEAARLGVPVPVNLWLYQEVVRRTASARAPALLSR
jgi:2-dehydropantoate 2-reductase